MSFEGYPNIERAEKMTLRDYNNIRGCLIKEGDQDSVGYMITFKEPKLVDWMPEKDFELKYKEVNEN